MLRTIFAAIGLLVVGSVALCGGCLYWAQRSGSAHQEEFFAAVGTGDVQKVTALLCPQLQAKIDEPLLAAWIAAVNANLGRYQGLSKSDFNTSTSYTEAGKRVESKGTVEFAKGSAHSELVYVDGKIVEFSLAKVAFPDDWQRPAAQSELYRDRGRKLLEQLLSDRVDAAFETMHEALQRAAPREKLAAMAEQFKATNGAVKTIHYAAFRFDPAGEHQLKLYYKIDTADGDRVGEVEFQFVGLKAELIGFELGVNADSIQLPDEASAK